MRKLFFATLWFILICTTSAFSKYIAVLETISLKDSIVSTNEKLFITDQLRAEAVTVLSQYDFTIMTRENINVMLPPGKMLEDCEGECLVETGRNISADYVVQGRIGKFAEDLTLTVELYETGSGKLLGNVVTHNKQVQGLLTELKGKSNDLFKAIIPEQEETAPISFDYEMEDNEPKVSTNIKTDNHTFPRWIPWVSLAVGSIFWVMGYNCNEDLKNARRDYDNMDDSFSVGDFDDRWEDIQYFKESRNAWYAIGTALFSLSFAIFIFD